MNINPENWTAMEKGTGWAILLWLGMKGIGEK